MKNNTKVRLHLSKQLFESLAKQVLTEAKGDMSGGAYTEAVKTPKGEKKEKAPKEEAKADKETKAEKHSDKKAKSENLNLSKNDEPNMVYNISDFKKKLLDLARQVSLMKGLDSSEIGAIIALLDDVIDKVQKGSIVNPLKAATKTFKATTGGVKKEMETITAEGDEINELDPQTMSAMQQGFTHLPPGGVLAQLTDYLPVLIAALGGAVALGGKLKKAGVSDKDAAKAVEAAKKIEKEAK